MGKSENNMYNVADYIMNSAADTLWTVRQIHYEQCGRYIMNSATDYIMNSAADTLWTVRQITLWTAPQINYEQCGRYIMNSAILYWLELNCRRARKKAHMRSTPSLRSFPNVAFQTVPVFVWLTMALSRPFNEDHRALPLSTHLSSRRSMVCCPWLCGRRWCLKPSRDE